MVQKTGPVFKVNSKVVQKAGPTFKFKVNAKVVRKQALL